MPRARVAVTKRIPAAPAAVYGVLADYRDGHQRILPPHAFRDFEVLQGGAGAGTVIRFSVGVAGRTRVVTAAITEPDPGRVLVETDLAPGGSVTTFTVAPSGAAGEASDVTITTDFPVRGGIAGRVEGWVASRVLAPLYREELARLAAFVRGPAAGGASESDPRR